jgi:hypothetical protein
MATTSKTRGGTRGLALRQVRWLARAIAAKPHLPAALAIW